MQCGGINMNTWVIGNVPVGYYGQSFAEKTAAKNGVEQLGEKTFFMKARIMAGQADLQRNELGLQDFGWLAKEEVKPLVTPDYWTAIRNMMAER